MKKDIFVFLIVSLALFLGFVLMSGCGTGGGGGGGAPFAAGVWVGKDGSDTTGDGTYNNPYATIQKGLDMAVTGETVGVKAGTYTETVTWPATANITLRGISNTSTVLQGSSKCIEIDYGAENPVIENIYIRDMTVMGGHVSNDSGGGIDLGQGDIVLYLANVIVSDCTAEESSGGGLYVKYSTSTVVATNCAFTKNNAKLGGAIYSAGQLNLKNCVVSNNTATHATDPANAAGIFSNSGGGRLENCLIYSNTAKTTGGGIIHNSLTLEVVNCDIVSNEATTTASGGIHSGEDKTKIINCIVWGNKAPIDPQIHGSPYVAYSNVQDGFTGTGNVSVEPQFVSVSDPFDLHLTSSSPTSVTQGGTTEGAPATDLDGNPRPGPDGKVSMGAYEY